MPSANVEAVRRGVEAWRTGDLEAMLREYDEQVEVVDPERVGPGPFRGHQAYKRWLAEWMEAWELYDARIEGLVEVGDCVVLLQHHVGRAKGSGIELDQRGGLLVRLRQGKIVLHRPYTHRSEALAAAGLADADDWRVAIETLVRGYEAWNRRDVDAVVGMMEPDAEFVPIEQSVLPPFRGPEGLRDFFAASMDVWESFAFVPLVFVPVGDAVLVELDVRGRAHGSGIELEEHWAHVYTQERGRLVRLRAFRAVGDALQALAYPDSP